MAGNYCTRMEKLLSLSSSTEFLEQLSGGVEESRRRRRDIIPLPLFDRSINNNLRVRVEKSRVSWKGERERERVVFLDRARHFYIQRFHSLVYLGRGRFARWDRRLKRVARRRATGRMGGIANCPFPSIYTRSLTTRYVPWIGRIFEKRGRERERREGQVEGFPYIGREIRLSLIRRVSQSCDTFLAKPVLPRPLICKGKS